MSTQIKHELLKTLREASGHPLLEDVLRAQAETRIRPRPTKADLDDALNDLKRLGFIAAQENELEPENPYWVLDERGQAYCITKRL